MKTPIEQWQEFQEQSFQVLKSQQETYLASIRAWRAQLAAATAATQQGGTTSGSPGQTPRAGQTPAGGQNFATFPTLEEVAEINQAYLRKIGEQQQEFLRQLAALSTEQP